MASMEIHLDDFTMPQRAIRDGRRVVVIPGDPELVLVLPRGGDGPLRRIGLVFQQLADDARAAERGDLHRGGTVVATAAWPAA